MDPVLVPPTVNASFTSIVGPHGWCRARVDGTIRAAQTVIARDELEGATAVATMVEVHGPIAVLAVDWSTHRWDV